MDFVTKSIKKILTSHSAQLYDCNRLKNEYSILLNYLILFYFQVNYFELIIHIRLLKNTTSFPKKASVFNINNNGQMFLKHKIIISEWYTKNQVT